MEAGDELCWCAALPALPAGAIDADAAACLCPDCLRARIDELRRRAAAPT
jgi:hypothetical protein